ncbi:polysaccharide pyruvyl transferase family protein [Microlunatus elymi]|uniref:Polysaccharide pyruvyl transferase family protein n=1 Tax=Microlunatus elymi TaxID=2596828 RepID=A0A516PUQ0_9ACTN|nr:polysaccharide pyruvyl transferase family protein [Microlunatus elymi]QDP94926.1 polysaccharide pyruvyl transferase family protein [Microlunatus elymi]
MPRILIRSAKDPFLALSPEASLARNVFASNSGNMLFAEAVHKLLSVPGTEVISSGYVTDRVELSQLPETIEKINSEYDAFVIPLANAFRPSFRGQLQRLTRLIRRLDIPVVVVGVGAQAGSGAVELPESERDIATKFLSAVLDKSAKVGVRGEITRRCLASLGFGDEHIEVIGCPSLFAHGRDLTVTKKAAGLTEDSPIAANLTLSQVRVAKIINRATERYPNLIYVPQTIDELRMLLWGVPHSKLLDPEMPARLDHPLYRQNRMRFFLDPIVWHRFLAEREFAFGTRIHGNIAALSVGTPAYLLAFDSRTTELADYHAIPYASARKIAPDTDPAELYERADFGAFNSRQPEAFDHYLRFLEKNDLQHIHQPGNENPDFGERLAEINFPAGVGSPYVTGAEQTEQLLGRLRWLYGGPDADRERSFGAYQPEPFGPLPAPGIAPVVSAPAAKPAAAAPVGLGGRVKRHLRRTLHRFRG